MTDWKVEHCSSQPAELQTIAPGKYIQRRNIQEITHEAMDGMEAFTDWQCESREITVDEYHQIIVDDTLEAHTASIDYIMMMADIV